MLFPTSIRRGFAGIPAGLLLAAISGILLASCIDRSNPYDPVNLSGIKREEIIKADRPSLDSLLREGESLAGNLLTYLSRFRDDSTANAARLAANDDIRWSNSARLAENGAIDAFNRDQTDADSLRFQAFYRTLDSLRAYGPYAEFESRKIRLQLLQSRAAGIMAAANFRAAPHVIYTRSQMDSELAPFVRDSAGYARLQAVLDSGNSAIAVSNVAVAAYNLQQETANTAVRDFNEAVAFRKAGKTNPPILKPDSLQVATNTAKPGDTLLIGPGILPVDLRFSSGTQANPIVIRGAPGQSTILSAAPKGAEPTENVGILAGSQYVRFENLVIRGGAVSGLKLEAGAKGISFHRCIFDSSGKWGLEVVDSDVEMVDCEVRANRGGGMRISGSTTADVRIRIINVLVARNGGHGIEVVGQQGEISHSTFSDNQGAGLQVVSPLRLLTVSNSIFSLNREYGIFREPTSVNQDGFLVKECDLWGNLLANWSLRNMDSSHVAGLTSKNLEVEPAFVNPPAFDYGLIAGSELAEYENLPLPVVIGYRRKP